MRMSAQLQTLADLYVRYYRVYETIIIIIIIKIESALHLCIPWVKF